MQSTRCLPAVPIKILIGGQIGRERGVAVIDKIPRLIKAGGAAVRRCGVAATCGWHRKVWNVVPLPHDLQPESTSGVCTDCTSERKCQQMGLILTDGHCSLAQTGLPCLWGALVEEHVTSA